MKRLVQVLRWAGVAVLLAGTVIFMMGGWWEGVSSPAADQVLIPVHLFLIVVGILLFVAPQIFPWATGLVLLTVRPTWGHKVLDSLENADYENSGQQENESDLGEILNTVRELKSKSNRRYFTVLGLGGGALLVAPLVTAEIVDQRNFLRDCFRLSHLVQHERLDFDSSNVFRRALDEVRPSFRSFAVADSSSDSLFAYLDLLYGTEVVDTALFESALTEIYEERIAQNARRDLGVLLPEALAARETFLGEPPLAVATALTVQGLVALTQGDDGKFVKPYLQARQLLQAATALGEDVPAAWNGLGQAYANMIVAHEAYSALFEDAAKPTLEKTIGELTPQTRVALAREAVECYERSLGIDPSAFARARALNNKADIVISLLREVHENGVDLTIQTSGDREFVNLNLDAPPVPRPVDWKPSGLIAILQRLETEVSQAAILGREPDIFFTRAQLRSLAGALVEKYGLQGNPWMDPEAVRTQVIADLYAARSLGLPATYFEREEATRLGLAWAWADPAAVPYLEAVVRGVAIDE